MKKSRKSSMIIIITITALFLAAGIIILVGSDYELNIKEYTLVSDKVDSDFNIAFIADLHCSHYGENEDDLVDAVVSSEPDIVLFGGDIFDNRKVTENAESLMRRVSRLYPCYGVMGNHEYRLDMSIDKVAALYDDCGVSILDNANACLNIAQNKVNICGANMPSDGTNDHASQAQTALCGIDSALFTIAISHRPDTYKYFEGMKTDLLLCGHAHGGQWRIPHLLNGFYAPNQGLFPRHAGGLYTFDEGKMTMIVSRGLAKDNTIVPRLFNPPELVTIKVQKK